MKWKVKLGKCSMCLVRQQKGKNARHLQCNFTMIQRRRFTNRPVSNQKWKMPTITTENSRKRKTIERWNVLQRKNKLAEARKREISGILSGSSRNSLCVKVRHNSECQNHGQKTSDHQSKNKKETKTNYTLYNGKRHMVTVASAIL